MSAPAGATERQPLLADEQYDSLADSNSSNSEEEEVVEKPPKASVGRRPREPPLTWRQCGKVLRWVSPQPSLSPAADHSLTHLSFPILPPPTSRFCRHRCYVCVLGGVRMPCLSPYLSPGGGNRPRRLHRGLQLVRSRGDRHSADHADGCIDYRELPGKQVTRWTRCLRAGLMCSFWSLIPTPRPYLLSVTYFSP